MRPDVLQTEFEKILRSSFYKTKRHSDNLEDMFLSFSEVEMLRLWDILGEELGIDLSLASSSHRRLLFESCYRGEGFNAKDFISLLWLVYFADVGYYN